MKNTNKVTAGRFFSIFMAFSIIGLSIVTLYPKETKACCGAAATAITSQTSAQATQSAALLMRIDLMAETIKGAINTSTTKINSAAKKTGELQNQQKKEIFDIQQQSVEDAVCNGDSKSNEAAKDKTKAKALTGLDKAAQDDAGKTSGDMTAQTVSNDNMHEQRRLLVDEHGKNYCSDQDKLAGYCGEDGKVATKDLQNADIRADRFFVDAYDQGKKDVKDDKDVRASQIFYQYIVGSDSSGVIPSDLIGNDDSAKVLREKQLELAAYGSISKYILATIQSERKKADSSGGDLGAFLELKDADGKPIKDPSLIQTLKAFPKAKIEEYANKAGKDMKTAYYQKENLRALAFGNYMLVKQYIQMQQLSVLFASKMAYDLKPAHAEIQSAISDLGGVE